MKTFIYCLNDPISLNPKYIGKSNTPTKRLVKGHLKTRGVSKKNSWIKSLKEKGLTPTLEIIDEISETEWQFWEKHYISLYKSWGFELTNMTIGGDGVLSYTKEVREKMSLAKKGKPAWNKGLHLSATHRQNLCGPKGKESSRKGKTWEEIYGRNQAEMLKQKARARNKRKSLSEATRDKIRQKLTNKRRSFETKKKIGDANSRAILKLDKNNIFIKEYKSTREAKKEHKGDIIACLKGRQKSADGYIWIYKPIK